MENRYTRHIQLENIGVSGQNKLAKAKVLVIGAGGLGCPVLQYLTTSGIGTLGIVDYDTVSITNLPRQILYTANDIDLQKVVVAKKRLNKLNPDVNIKIFPDALSIQNCINLIKQFDIIVDCTDNFNSRYLINDCCIILNKPMVFGALYKFEGQVSVFNYQKGPSYRCLFPNPPSPDEVPNCNDIGVLSILPGIIGLLQANEVIKIILNIGDILSGKILYLNTSNYEQRIIKFYKNESLVKEIENKETPEAIKLKDCTFIKSLSLNDLDDISNVIWIDVREHLETPLLEFENLIKVPLSSIKNTNKIKNDGKQIVFFCQSGIRSQKATKWALQQGITNCFSLEEGAVTLNDWLKIKYER